MKKDQWTEADLLALPVEENDQVERKSGRLLERSDAFLDAMAKALSAFANSGGGTLVLGAEDDGELTGVEPRRGGESLRDWLEQKLPNLLDYHLSDFRVHTVVPDRVSAIPPGKVVIVVEVGDSALAPHQSKRDHIYYHRAAGRSRPAPHFYIELLRTRVTGPTLHFALQQVMVTGASLYEDGVLVELELSFRIENVGRMAAYKWRLSAKSYDVDLLEGRESLGDMTYFFGRANFPNSSKGRGGISIDDTILPGNSRIEKADLAVYLGPELNLAGLVPQVTRAVVDLTINYQLATETSPGELTPVALAGLVDPMLMSASVLDFCPDAADVEAHHRLSTAHA